MGFHCIVEYGGREGEWCEADDKCKNPRALPPFPAWEGVLATEIGELGNMEGCVFCNKAKDWVMRSITSFLADALPDFEDLL